MIHRIIQSASADRLELGLVVLRLPSIHWIDGSLRERLQTLGDPGGVVVVVRREIDPLDRFLTLLTLCPDIGPNILWRHQSNRVALGRKDPAYMVR
ncbi:MAG: hypothetical protein AAGC57_21470, partial [Pseudomonadota bacterium]